MSIRPKFNWGRGWWGFTSEGIPDKPTPRPLPTHTCKPWQSNALWPEDVYTDLDGSCTTTGTHTTEAEAQAVCDTLMEGGWAWGGERKRAPIKTWVSEIESE